jgi:hypothetical protein
MLKIPENSRVFFFQKKLNFEATKKKTIRLLSNKIKIYYFENAKDYLYNLAF